MPKKTQAGFLHSVWRFAKDLTYEWKSSRLEKQIAELQPTVDALVGKKDVETLSEDEVVNLTRYAALKQNQHTYRRRKFMLDSQEFVEAQGERQPTAWERLENELKAKVSSQHSQRYLGGDRARLWSQEAMYRRAEEYSRENQRLTLKERSLNFFNKVPSHSTRNVYLEPRVPPTYQARAAVALKNEDRTSSREMEARLKSLETRNEIELPCGVVRSKTAMNRATKDHGIEGIAFNAGIISVRIPRRNFSTSSKMRQILDSGEKKTDSNGKEVEDIEKKSKSSKTLGEKTRAWFARNGPLGVTLYLTIGAIDLALIYLILKSGIDLSPVLAFLGLEGGAGAATFALAYGIHKMIAPVRAALIMFLMPYARPYWNRMVAAIERFALKHDDEIQKISDKIERHREKKNKQKD